jgi:Zn-dependent M28 family amino/carboxypeptidase
VATWKPPEILGSIAEIPAVGTSKEVAEHLKRLQKKGEVKVRITAKHESGPAKTWNVVGEIAGKKKPEEIIIVGAHFDGHDIAVGAMDDAAGACVVLEAARLLARHKDALRRTVRFITFPGEENGAFGSAGYVIAHLDELDKMRFMFNLDGAARASRPGIMVEGWPDPIPLFKKISEEMGQPIPVNVDFRIYSDHLPFILRGIRTARLIDSQSFQSVKTTRGWGHTKADTEDKVDIRNLREVSAVLARILLRIANIDEIPLKRKTKDEINAMLRKYEYDEVMKILGSYPSWLK